MDDQLRARVDADGFAIREGAVAPETVQGLLAALGGIADHAVRDVMRAVPEVAHLARSPEVRALVEPVLGPGAFAARGLFFDKTPAANWKVAWHQDLTIAARYRREVPGFGPWSMKAGIPHVRPPDDLLARMLTIRLHLDPCGPENGPLRVLPGSHRSGRLGPGQIAEWRARVAEATCLAGPGGVLVMRPLLLHASSAAAAPGHRRVVHLEFAAEDLPGGLEWHVRG